MIKISVMVFVVAMAILSEAAPTEDQKKIQQCHLEQMKCNRACKGDIPCLIECQTALEDCSGYEKGKPKEDTAMAPTEDQKKIQKCHLEQMKCNRACKGDIPCLIECQTALEDCSGYEKGKPKEDTAKAPTEDQKKIQQCHLDQVKCNRACKGGIPCLIECQTALEDCSGYEKGKPKDESAFSHTPEQKKFLGCQLEMMKCNRKCKGSVPCFNKCHIAMEDCTGYEKGKPKETKEETKTEEETETKTEENESENVENGSYVMAPTEDQKKIQKCHLEQMKCNRTCKGGIPCLVECQTALEDCSGYEKGKPKEM